MKITCRVVADVKENSSDKKIYQNIKYLTAKKYYDDETEFTINYKLQIIKYDKKNDTPLVFHTRDIILDGKTTYNIDFCGVSYSFNSKNETLSCNNLVQKI